MSTEPPAALTTIRYDKSLTRLQPNASPVYLLDWHFKRLQETHVALQASSTAPPLPFAIHDASDLQDRVSLAVSEWKDQQDVIYDDDDQAFRIRLTADIDSRIHITVFIVNSLPISRLFPTNLIRTLDFQLGGAFAVVLDTVITPISTTTTLKTTDRTAYDNARDRAGIWNYKLGKEVLLHNDRGQIIDGSITTPYFWRNGEWITPSSNCGGQRGATRYMALDQRLCREGVILRESIRHEEMIWLSNAVRGFFQGAVQINTT